MHRLFSASGNGLSDIHVQVKFDDLFIFLFRALYFSYQYRYNVYSAIISNLNKLHAMYIGCIDQFIKDAYGVHWLHRTYRF